MSVDIRSGPGVDVLGGGGNVLYLDQGMDWMQAAFDPAVFTHPKNWQE